MGSRKQWRLETQKPCARLRDADPAISIRRSCHGFRMSDGVHPFGSDGHLARYAQRPDCCWAFFKHDLWGSRSLRRVVSGKSESSSWKTMRKRAKEFARA